MDPCRYDELGRLVVSNDGAVSLPPLSLPPDAVSLVIHNPSFAFLACRWGATPVDPSDSRSGFDFAIPGPSLCSVPIKAGETQLSVAWGTPPVPFGYGETYVVEIDESGADVISIWSTPNNQGTFIGPLNGGPVPVRNTGT
jgi:hypothetical protein